MEVIWAKVGNIHAAILWGLSGVKFIRAEKNELVYVCVCASTHAYQKWSYQEVCSRRIKSSKAA